MVLRLKTRESRSLPGLQIATFIFSFTKIGTPRVARRGPFLLLCLKHTTLEACRGVEQPGSSSGS